MESTFIPFSGIECDERIREILDSAAAFEELKTIPGRDQLTYTNGFYVDCSAVFIDIRDSSLLPESHTRPVLGKLYRAYISEAVAIMNCVNQCSEVFIQGDSVSAIFNTPYKSDVDAVVEVAGRLASMNKLLNYRLSQKGYETIRCGVGVAYGRALMLKAGYKGSGINEVIWMGDVVNHASNLCHEGYRGTNASVQVSVDVWSNLKAEYQALFSPVYGATLGTAHQVVRYQGWVINQVMENQLSALIAAS